MNTQNSKTKLIKYALVTLCSMIAVVGLKILQFYRTDLYLPDGTETVIDQVLTEELPEIVQGETGYADANGVKIWYEVLNNTTQPKGTILLIRGYTRTALSWQPSFYEPLLAAGYQVIRFDNRDVGMSDWITDWSEETAYTLPDMAGDAVAVLDTVGVKRAHVVGISMGGSIAQEIAILHPERVSTLTLIATSSHRGGPELLDASDEFGKRLEKIALRYAFFNDIENQLRLRIAVEEAVRGNADYVVDLKQAAQVALYEIRHRKGFNPVITEHQWTAINKSPARYAELQNLAIPTLVVHGSEDCLSSREHAEELAATIPNASTLWLEGMGHNVVEPYAAPVTARILELIETAVVSNVWMRFQ